VGTSTSSYGLLLTAVLDLLEVIARLCTARDAHRSNRSAVRIAAAAGGDKDTAARASFGDPRAMAQLKRAKDTPAQFTSQRTVKMTNKDVMSGDAVSDPVLRSMLLDPANWTQGTPLSRWDTPSDEEFVSNINEMKVNNYNYWSHMFRDYPICVAAQNYMFKRLPPQFAWPDDVVEALGADMQLHELEAAIEAANTGRAADKQGIVAEVLQHDRRECAIILMHYYNACIKIGRLSPRARETLLAQLFKGVGDTRDLKRHRPHTVTQTREYLYSRWSQMLPYSCRVGPAQLTSVLGVRSLRRVMFVLWCRFPEGPRR
jgi:hypothetical protein